MKVSGPRTSLRMAAALALAALAPLASAGDKYVVKAGTVITLAGEPIKDGVIVVEGGKITAVGKADEVKVPWDAEVLDKPELTAFPGFVEAHTSSGMDRANENIDVAPFLNIRDSIDPVGFYFEDSLRWGVLTMNVQQGAACVIGGQGTTVRPYGMTVEEMLVRPNSGLKMSARPKNGKSRATQARALRNAFADLRRHLEELVQEKKDGDDRARREALYQGRDLEGERGKGRAMSGEAWKVEGLERVPRGEIDEKLEPLLDVVEGRLPVWFHCGSAMDVRTAIDIATTNGFLKQTRLVLDPPCWKAADAIAEAGVPVVLNDGVMHTERDPERWADSFGATIYKLLASIDQTPPEMHEWLKMAGDVIAKTGFPPGLDRDGLIDGFISHNNAVRETIPADQLLLFQVKQGWEPLCQFLEAPVPGDSFPRTNDREEFWDRVQGNT